MAALVLWPCFHLHEQPAQIRLPGRRRMYWLNYLSGGVGVGQECSYPRNCLDPHPDKKWKMEHPSMFFSIVTYYLSASNLDPFPVEAVIQPGYTTSPSFSPGGKSLGCGRKLASRKAQSWKWIQNLLVTVRLCAFWGCKHPNRKEHCGLNQECSCKMWFYGDHQ